MNGLMMIGTIKASGGESDFFTKWAGYRAKVIVGSQELRLWSIKVKLLPNLLSSLNGALIMTIGGFSIMEGVMTTGIFIAFQNLMGNFQAPFNKLLNLGNTLQTTEMQIQRLDDVRRYEVDSLNYSDEEKFFESNRLSGELELKNVKFGYSSSDAPLIENFSLHLNPGHWVAIVGTSGSGKSTVAKIVTGLYEEWEGEILFDGLARRKIPRSVIVNPFRRSTKIFFKSQGLCQRISRFLTRR